MDLFLENTFHLKMALQLAHEPSGFTVDRQLVAIRCHRARLLSTVTTVTIDDCTFFDAAARGFQR